MGRLAMAVVAIATALAACGTEEESPEPECYVWESDLVCTDGDCVEHHQCLPCEGVMVSDSGAGVYWCMTDWDAPPVECTLTCEEGPPAD